VLGRQHLGRNRVADDRVDLATYERTLFDQGLDQGRNHAEMGPDQAELLELPTTPATSREMPWPSATKKRRRNVFGLGRFM
jgi:hypothetical protein